jgi:hypothetical protein
MQQIINLGGLFSDNENQRQKFLPRIIGYPHIKKRRSVRSVPIPPGGYLGDYVPFYFGPRSPMLYTINQGNVEDYQESQSEIVHLVSDIGTITAKQLDFLFTDRHADLSHTIFSHDLEQIDQLVDFTIMSGSYWNNIKDYPDRKERRQAEFLIHRFCPWDCFFEIGVYNDKIRNKVEAILSGTTHKPLVSIQKSWYY